MGRRSRQVEAAAVAAIVPVVSLVPFWLLAMAVLWLPVRLVSDVPYWWFPAGWLAAGLLLFVRPVQVAVLTPLFGARQPSPEEYAAIEPLWRELTMRIGIPPERFVVRILPSDDINAFACGGHLVVVTSYAVAELPERELAGVLAHELSHHLGYHTTAHTIGHWLSIPVVLLARVGFFLQNVARAATDSFASESPSLTMMGRILTFPLTAVSWVFLSALYASDALSNLFGHGSEFEADRRTVRMGYGRALADALRRVVAHGGGERAIGWRQRLGASHPAARTRVARIEAMLRHPSERPGR